MNDKKKPDAGTAPKLVRELRQITYHKNASSPGDSQFADRQSASVMDSDIAEVIDPIKGPGFEVRKKGATGKPGPMVFVPLGNVSHCDYTERTQRE